MSQLGLQALNGGPGDTPFSRWALILLMLFSILAVTPAWSQEKERITVIGATPVGADDFDPARFPGRVQSADSYDLETSVGLDVSDYLNRNFSGVHINAAQGNPLQPDLYYRGFAASPLLGLPMGLSIYQNGVRLNEPLGDTVNWDLIPMNAVASMNLISGANALYGLNTLGGSIALSMKNGFTHPGTSLEIESGVYQRLIGNFESGGNHNNLAYYVNLQRFSERGWRDLSPSWAENLYSSVNWQGSESSLGLSYHRATSDLKGNGPLPIGLIERDRGDIFTAPDITENDMYMWTLSGDYELTGTVQLSGNLYYRNNDTNSFNGDAAEEEEIEDAAIAGSDNCDFNGTIVACNRLAINNISARGQEAMGAVLEIDFPLAWFGMDHDIDAGIGYYAGRARFDSRVQEALLGHDRSTQGLGSVSGDFEHEENTRVKTRTENLYLYLNDSLALNELWNVTVSGYYHDSTIKLHDRTGQQPELNGNHSYNNFNWGIGVNYQWRPLTDIYASYSESSRLPTPIELACSEQVRGEVYNRVLADELSGGASLEMATDEAAQAEECRLPNAFLSDPPLDEVVSKSVELGLRGRLENSWNWFAGLFYTKNEDDIIFQTTGRATGLFKNVDQTRRAGLEAGIAGSFGRFTWNTSYTYVKATFEDDFQVLSPNHVNADDGDRIAVDKGDSIPGIPENIFKVAVDYEWTEKFLVGMDLIAVSDSHLRGDESNQMDKVNGYAIVNARLRYQMNNWVEVFLNVENLFDKEYENFGLIGEDPSEVIAGLDPDPRFLGLGAPVSAWAGVKVSF